ncbi:hypothetical protein VTN77DRAFT_7626 [Rasamsonia byssochlamydoides]|uniref:uncharacterized protein n=1 Tax=Rasamsonia byssochlamydoides TaxID=89139 RepID=UPI0037444594
MTFQIDGGIFIQLFPIHWPIDSMTKIPQGLGMTGVHTIDYAVVRRHVALGDFPFRGPDGREFTECAKFDYGIWQNLEMKTLMRLED